ncbi:putative thioredoxin [Xylariomycetidae sp. FL2044]|nr:putative thioredoxin [Xylariomycetidae sp. FL2044]
MAKPIEIQSAEQFGNLLGSSRIVVADFYANWCAPCKQIAPYYQNLSANLSRPNLATFVKVNIESEGGKPIASEYAVTHLPTFIVFRNGSVMDKIKGADPQKLQSVLEKLKSEIEGAGEGGSGSGSGSGDGGSGGGIAWRGADLPRGYTDISDTIDVRGLELLNSDDAHFSVRTLFNKAKPSALDKGKAASEEKDWVESDTDEQLLLFMPFNSAVKLHTLQITSIPPANADDDDDDEIPARPKTIKLFTNRPHNLGFDEAEDINATQTIEIGERDWNASGTVNIGLRFVRFQNITSVVLFVVEGDGQSDKVRLDRVRLIGESGEKREMGKLEKIGDEAGE